MTSANIPLEIGIFVRERTLLSAVHGLVDLFRFADRLARERTGWTRPVLRVCHFVEGPDGISRIVDPAFEREAERGPEPAIIIVPPRETVESASEEYPAAGAWLAARHAAGVPLAAICGGVFLLAQAGLLDDRAVTTHWACADDLAKGFPAIRVEADELVIDDGDIITAGGMMAWADLGLVVIERLLGRAAMMETARYMMVDPPGREQRFYRRFLPRQDHGDPAVAMAQRQLHEQGPGSATVTEMAGWARLEVRTFMRRFRKATGLRPNEYCQRLRVERAREMLEGTTAQIGEIAHDVGYADPASFRKVFVRVMGLCPVEYRKRFGGARRRAGTQLDA
jgi:transcriptional regulator GlxA family with amidase domain